MELHKDLVVIIGLCSTLFTLCLAQPYCYDTFTSQGKGNDGIPPGSRNGWENGVCKNGYRGATGWGSCVPPNGCPSTATLPPGFQEFLNPSNTFTKVDFVEPVPRETFVYECQNSTIFLGVFNVSLTAFDYLANPRNRYVNTLSCLTVVPWGPNMPFSVDTYNSCDHAGGCGNCGGCNCSCRVPDPYWWNCCYDPCFACRQCCGCAAMQGNWDYYLWTGSGAVNTVDDGSCLQCNHDGWCGEPNGQMLTPTVCQCMSIHHSFFCLFI